MALGHQVVWEEANDGFLMPDSGINILVEGFAPESTQIIADAHSRGARFICIATEEPSPYGFNGGVYEEWVNRQKEFPNTAKFFEGILYLVPNAGAWFSQWAPSAYVELGHTETLIRTGDIEPTYDFGFFGTMSPRREAICQRLADYSGKENAIWVVDDYPDQVTRDKEMRKARVILQIRRQDYLGFVSSTRCNTALCLGRPVIAEPHLSPKPWNEIVKFSESIEAFYQDALKMCAAWKIVHAAQFVRFREKLTPEFCIGRALKEIGLKCLT